MQTAKTPYDIARAIVRKGMRDFSDTTTPPKMESGFYALVIHDTGLVWFDETTNTKSLLTRYRAKSLRLMPTVVQEARKRGSKVDLYILTRPDVCSAQAIENELYEADLLADRKRPNRDGEGILYSIRHTPSNSFFVCSCRRPISAESFLNNFIYRLKTEQAGGENVKLAAFVTEYAGDILAERGFSIMEVGKFINREDEITKKEELIRERAVNGNCLNLRQAE